MEGPLARAHISRRCKSPLGSDPTSSPLNAKGVGRLCPFLGPTTRSAVQPRSWSNQGQGAGLLCATALIGVWLGGCGSHRTSRNSAGADATTVNYLGGDGAPGGGSARKAATAAVGPRCRDVSGRGQIQRERRNDGTIGWVLTFDAQASAGLESHAIIGDDGLESADLLMLDCLIDAFLSAASVCSEDWRHEGEAATPLRDGRLQVRGVCTPVDRESR